MTFLLTVLASVGVEAFLLTIASTMAFFAAVDTLHNRGRRHDLQLLLLAVLGLVSEILAQITRSLAFLMWPSSPQLLQSGTPRSCTNPAEERRSRFCAAFSGQPSAIFARRGLSDSWTVRMYSRSGLPIKSTMVMLTATSCFFAIK